MSFRLETFSKDVTGWARDHVVDALRNITYTLVDQQRALGNEPSSIVVDGSAFKSITSAEKVVVVTFGAHLAREIVAAAEKALRGAITFSTQAKTGKLESSWEWTLVQGAGGRSSVVDPHQLKTMAYTDRLILRPTRVMNERNQNYATAVNQAITIGGSRRAKSQRGLFSQTAQAIRKVPEVRKNFSVIAGFSFKYLAPGEVATAGKGGRKLTGYIMIKPKRRGRIV